MPNLRCCNFEISNNKSQEECDVIKSPQNDFIQFKKLIEYLNNNNFIYFESSIPSNFSYLVCDQIKLQGHESIFVIKPKMKKKRPSKKLRRRLRNQIRKNNILLIEKFVKNEREKQGKKKKLELKIIEQKKKEQLEKEKLKKQHLVPVCPICLEKIENMQDKTIISLNCGHLLHTNCYQNLIKFNSSCPCCRTPII